MDMSPLTYPACCYAGGFKSSKACVRCYHQAFKRIAAYLLQLNYYLQVWNLK